MLCISLCLKYEQLGITLLFVSVYITMAEMKTSYSKTVLCASLFA